ncbi:hypothetical protein QUF80_07945 [Desulfococcaceae bacterium HSG8]|nr:hypothetical protein [Desulfococcaceae bacterium HSG8]
MPEFMKETKEKKAGRYDCKLNVIIFLLIVNFCFLFYNSCQSDQPDKTEPQKEETETKKSETESEKPETESEKPETESEKPETESEKPETESEKPETESEKPETEPRKEKSETKTEPRKKKTLIARPRADKKEVRKTVRYIPPHKYVKSIKPERLGKPVRHIGSIAPREPRRNIRPRVETRPRRDIRLRTDDLRTAKKDAGGPNTGSSEEISVREGESLVFLKEGEGIQVLSKQVLIKALALSRESATLMITLPNSKVYYWRDAEAGTRRQYEYNENIYLFDMLEIGSDYLEIAITKRH